MTTVALIGPDGAGKTSVAKCLPEHLSVPIKYLYMGVSAESSNIVLPSTRVVHRLKRALGASPDTAGPPSHDRSSARPRSYLKRRLRDGRAALRLGNRLAEEWYRQWLTWRWEQAGNLVIFDRHFFADYYAYDMGGTGLSWSRRLHGWILARAYPRPDIVIYLDAPGEVLLARKGEGTVEALEQRRSDYRALASVVDVFIEVDATQALDVVTEQVAAAISARLGAGSRS
jgi:thymidylate kinase